MAQEPVVYILHGDDELAISDFVKGLFDSLGDPSMAEMNTTRLDGRTHTLDDLVSTANAISFLAPRRLVIFERPLERFRLSKRETDPQVDQPADSGSQQQKKFLSILENLPPTTMLVLVFNQPLTSDRDLKAKKPKINWLEKWAKEAGERVSLNKFMLPSGPELIKWIQARAKKLNGQLTNQAAAVLAEQIGPEPRILESEIQKLLAYVNYARPVEADDVQHVSSTIQHQEDFGLVNALRTKNFNQAMKMLHIELDNSEPLEVFPGIVYQFRLLLLTREVLDHGGLEADVIELGKIINRDGRPLHNYVARLAVEQARRFTHGELDDIYRRLLEVDVAMKTSAMVPDELALELLVTQLTQG